MCLGIDSGMFVFSMHFAVIVVGQVVRMHWAPSMDGPLPAPQVSSWLEFITLAWLRLDRSKDQLHFVPSCSYLEWNYIET